MIGEAVQSSYLLQFVGWRDCACDTMVTGNVSLNAFRRLVHVEDMLSEVAMDCEINANGCKKSSAC